MALELTVVVPTLNERENVGVIVERLDSLLAGIEWEVIFVDDDSVDGTPEAVRTMAIGDRRIRCLQRIGRRGLSSACIEGILASAAPVIAVMDGDLQHDETVLLPMLAAVRDDRADVVIGSRYLPGGGVGNWDASRQRVSRIATSISQRLIKTDVTDPMSGFFMLRREVFEAAVRGLSGLGFKILLDILASLPQPVRVLELPYTFRSRQAGESKLDSLVAWEFLMLLMDKLFGRYVPVRFVLFAIVGCTGLGIHLAVLAVANPLLGISFDIAQSLATLTAMTTNFLLNNLLTYRDLRLRGSRLLRGLISFYLVCAVGAVANVGVATMVYEADETWWLAGIAGSVVGAVWNYAMSSLITWRRPARRAARPAASLAAAATATPAGTAKPLSEQAS